jgi:serine/threonine-protein kinase
VNSLGTILVAMLTAALTAAGSVYVIQRYELMPPRPKVTVSEVTVPALVGLPEADARANLKAIGLVYLAAPRESSMALKPGLVTRQSVEPGRAVKSGHAISVALADDLPKAPNVLGLNATDAAVRITQSGYKMQVGEPLAQEGAPEGSVVEQTPKADAPLEKDQPIVIRLALTQAVAMPKVVGQDVKAATAALEKLGLKVNVRWMNLAETATFIVLSQKPAAKSKLKPGDEVELSANR